MGSEMCIRDRSRTPPRGGYPGHPPGGGIPDTPPGGWNGPTGSFFVSGAPIYFGTKKGSFFTIFHRTTDIFWHQKVPVLNPLPTKPSDFSTPKYIVARGGGDGGILLSTQKYPPNFGGGSHAQKMALRAIFWVGVGSSPTTPRRGVSWTDSPGASTQPAGCGLAGGAAGDGACGSIALRGVLREGPQDLCSHPTPRAQRREARPSYIIAWQPEGL